MTSLKFEPIAPNDRDWWNQYLRRAKLINDMSDEFGKSFYKLQTFKGKVMEIPLGQINLIANPCQDEDKLVILPGVGLVAKGSIMAEYTPLTVGNLYKPPKKESA